VIAPACSGLLSRLRFEPGSAGIRRAMKSSPREAGGNRRLSELVEARKPDIRVLAERYGISNVRIFGSVARGDSHARSDIDFLVDIPREATLFDLSGFRRVAVLSCPATGTFWRKPSAYESSADRQDRG
jgi:hypothetical protein